MPEYIAVFTVGGLVYGLLEILWRGWTHWTMLICGGVCFTLMYLIARTPMRPAHKLIASAAVNLTLGMGVWDYSALPFDLMGQICPRFSLMWLGLSVPGLRLCRLMRRAFSK